MIESGVEAPQLWHPELGEPVPGQDAG